MLLTAYDGAIKPIHRCAQTSSTELWALRPNHISPTSDSDTSDSHFEVLIHLTSSGSWLPLYYHHSYHHSWNLWEMLQCWPWKSAEAWNKASNCLIPGNRTSTPTMHIRRDLLQNGFFYFRTCSKVNQTIRKEGQWKSSFYRIFLVKWNFYNYYLFYEECLITISPDWL